MKEVYSDRSKICGRGLFIKQGAKKGERISLIKGTMKHKVNKTVRDALGHPDWVGVGKDKWIDPAVPYKYLNHSCDPNCGVKGTVTLYALRDIKPDEELTIDYATTEGDPRWIMENGAKCLCKAKHCRQMVRSIQFLPRKRFESYLPYIPKYFQQLYYSYRHHAGV